MRNTWTHLMVSDTFYFIVDDIFFCPKDDKPYCPLTQSVIQTPRRETYYPCESLISRAFNGDYSAFYHNYFIFSKIQVSYGYH